MPGVFCSYVFPATRPLPDAPPVHAAPGWVGAATPSPTAPTTAPTIAPITTAVMVAGGHRPPPPPLPHRRATRGDVHRPTVAAQLRPVGGGSPCRRRAPTALAAAPCPCARRGRGHGVPQRGRPATKPRVGVVRPASGTRTAPRPPSATTDGGTRRAHSAIGHAWPFALADADARVTPTLPHPWLTPPPPPPRPRRRPPPPPPPCRCGRRRGSPRRARETGRSTTPGRRTAPHPRRSPTTIPS